MSRLLKILLLLTILSGLSSAALADVTPDVEVHLISPFTAVKAGETYQGQLEISCGEDGTASKFDMKSEGWNTSLNASLRSTAMKAGDRFTLDFTATAVDSEKKIHFTFDFQGKEIPLAIDLSEGNVQRMTEGAPVRKLSGFLDTPGNPSWETTDEILGVKTQVITDPALRVITVSGRFGCNLEGGGYLPAHSITVEIWDQDSGADDLMATGSTNFDGYYSIGFDSSFGDSGSDPDIYVKFILNNSRIRVYEPTSGDNYVYSTGVTTNYSGSNLDMGSLIPANPDMQASVFIHTQATRSWVHDYNIGYDVPAARFEWPSAAWPNCSPSGRIQIREDFSWRDGTIWHEHGHWFDHEMASWEPFNYCNGICDSSATNCGHCFWCEESQSIAWLEGWAQFHGYAISSWITSAYGVAPLSGVTAENISTCSGSYADALLTEGFIAALTQDIADSSNDSHGVFGSYTDRMSTGVQTVYNVNASDNPTGSQDFANKYVARYPAHRESFWETSANCGFWFDTTAPSVVTFLGSPSHSSGVSSPDPTVDLTWTTAWDNYSGIQGYSVSVTSNSPHLPPSTMNIGDVNSYTTTSLSPGNYYFNIRAVDNAGYWSNSYESWGPIVIRSPEPADLTSYQPTGWDYPLVPRSTSDTGGSYAPVPATLEGDATATYWNAYGTNQGEAATGSSFYAWLNIDGVHNTSVSWPEINPGGLYWAPNRPQIFVQAGRHTFTLRHDATDLVAEENETNNVTGSQFIWTVPSVGNNTLISRNSPPDKLGGWDQITSGPSHYNCDGLAMPTSGAWWHAMAVWADSDDNDFDCRLHTASTGAEDGFATSLAYSANGSGQLDAVFVNRNKVSGSSWDIGVPSWSGSGTYKAYHAASEVVSFGDSITVPMVEDQPLFLREFYVSSANTGPVSVTASANPADGSFRLVLFSKDYTQGTLFSGDQIGSDWNNSDGVSRVSTTVEDAGYYCLAVYRLQTSGLAPRDITIEISTTPPDLAPWTPDGWYAAITPRAAADGTAGSCPEPAVLHSSPDPTYLNVAATNMGPVASALPSRVFRDDAYIGYINWPVLSPGATVSYNWSQSFSMSAGRHVLSYRVDALQSIEETNENNNTRGEQWIWESEAMAPPMTAVRNAPPENTAGWSDVTTSETLWYNCDGLRLNGTQTGFWKALAILPESGSDFDLRLHQPSTGAKDGFSTSLVGSFEAGTKTEYVLIDQNSVTKQDYDVGVLRWAGSGNYRAQAGASTYHSGNPNNTWGPFEVADGGLLSMHEFFFSGQNYHITLENLSSADLGFAIHEAGNTYQNRLGAVSGADENGAGMNEMTSINPDSDAFHCIVVYRSDHGTGPAPFRLIIGNDLTAAGSEDLPTVSRLTGAYPNPFNPQTKVAFDLSKTDNVRISIYNVQGRLIRHLVDETLSAGRHTAVWMGRDNYGQSVASGVYFARMESSNGNSITKLVLVK